MCFDGHVCLRLKQVEYCSITERPSALLCLCVSDPSDVTVPHDHMTITVFHIFCLLLPLFSCLWKCYGPYHNWVPVPKETVNGIIDGNYGFSIRSSYNVFCLYREYKTASPQHSKISYPTALLGWPKEASRWELCKCIT